MATAEADKHLVQPKKNYVAELDGLRGIAVVAMLIEHIHINFGFKDIFQSTTHLTSGVDIFFILSGFLTTRILLSGGTTTRDKISFYVRRAARLMPAYLLFLCLVSIIWGVGPEMPWSLTYTFNYGRFFGFILSQTRPLAHTWSLCVEEHFYLVWPCIIWFLRKQSKMWCIVAIACGLILPVLADKEAGEQYLHYIRVYQPTHARLMSISIGCLLALHESRLRLNPNILLGLVAIFGSFLAILNWNPALQLFRMDDAPLAISLIKQNFIAALFFSIVLWSSYSGCRYLSMLFKDSRLAGLGRISYGSYLYHFPVYWLFAVNGPATQPSQYKPWLALICTFAAGWLSNRYYEEPIRQWARQLIRKKEATENICEGAVPLEN